MLSIPFPSRHHEESSKPDLTSRETPPLLQWKLLVFFFFIIRHKIYRVIQLIFIHILDISYCVSRHTQRRQKKLKTNLVLRIILTAKHSCMGLLLKDNDQIFYLHILSVQTCRLNDCLLDKWTNDSMSIHWILSYSLIQQTFIELCLVKIMAKS